MCGECLFFFAELIFYFWDIYEFGNMHGDDDYGCGGK